MLNYIWLGLILSAIAIGAWKGNMAEVTASTFEMAKFSVVTLALPLAGIMALWLGMMRLAERAGLIQILARLLRPVTIRLFPDVPADHPAVGSMLMNMSANMLGLGNAATPLGLRAMKDLESLNPRPGTASNAMCTFLALNTSCIQFIPATAVGILAVNGSANPTAIIGTAFLATLCAAIAAVGSAKILEKLRWFKLAPPDPSAVPENRGGRPDFDEPVPVSEPPRAMGMTGMVIIGVFLVFFAALFWDMAFPAGVSLRLEAGWVRGFAVPMVESASLLAIPFLVSFLPLVALLRGVHVYEEFVEGAKEGFQVAIRIIPYLVAILVAIGAFRAAGGIELLSQLLSPLLNRIGFPTELLPLAIMRPLSGSGSLGLFTEIVKTHGADSLLARTAGTMYGSTETTFYVLAVYFGAVAIRRTRHAVVAGLTGDLTGIIASVVICRAMFG